MSSAARNTPAIIARIEKLRDELIRRFQMIINLSSVGATDRNSAAIVQYQIQVETAALITTAEDAQSLIRQLQEMWLFGQLNTLEESQAQRQTDEDAKAIAGLLQQLTQLQSADISNGTASSGDGSVVMNGT